MRLVPLLLLLVLTYLNLVLSAPLKEEEISDDEDESCLHHLEDGQSKSEIIESPNLHVDDETNLGNSQYSTVGIAGASEIIDGQQITQETKDIIRVPTPPINENNNHFLSSNAKTSTNSEDNQKRQKTEDDVDDSASLQEKLQVQNIASDSSEVAAVTTVQDNNQKPNIVSPVSEKQHNQASTIHIDIIGSSTTFGPPSGDENSLVTVIPEKESVSQNTDIHAHRDNNAGYVNKNNANKNGSTNPSKDSNNHETSELAMSSSELGEGKISSQNIIVNKLLTSGKEDVSANRFNSDLDQDYIHESQVAQNQTRANAQSVPNPFIAIVLTSSSNSPIVNDNEKSDRGLLIDAQKHFQTSENLKSLNVNLSNLDSSITLTGLSGQQSNSALDSLALNKQHLNPSKMSDEVNVPSLSLINHEISTQTEIIFSPSKIDNPISPARGPGLPATESNAHITESVKSTINANISTTSGNKIQSQKEPIVKLLNNSSISTALNIPGEENISSANDGSSSIPQRTVEQGNNSSEVIKAITANNSSKALPLLFAKIISTKVRLPDTTLSSKIKSSDTIPVPPSESDLVHDGVNSRKISNFNNIALQSTDIVTGSSPIIANVSPTLGDLSSGSAINNYDISQVSLRTIEIAKGPEVLLSTNSSPSGKSITQENNSKQFGNSGDIKIPSNGTMEKGMLITNIPTDSSAKLNIPKCRTTGNGASDNNSKVTQLVNRGRISHHPPIVGSGASRENVPATVGQPWLSIGSGSVYPQDPRALLGNHVPVFNLATVPGSSC